MSPTLLRSATSALLLPGLLAAAPASPGFDTSSDFQVRPILSGLPDQGAWLSLAPDSLGRFFVSTEKGGLLRLTLPTDILTSDAPDIMVETMGSRITETGGMAWGRDSLYVSGEGPSGPGVYRVWDKNGNGTFEAGEEDVLIRLKAGGPRGPHGLAFGPNGDLYLANGHETTNMATPSPASPYRRQIEGTPLPRLEDPNGLSARVKAPAGHILRHDFATRDTEVFAGGLNNPGILTFNEKGDLFTVDPENSRDRGLPWWRPTRVVHVMAGGEYGWRAGSAPWPDRWRDQNAPAGDIGLGEGTGAAFCNHDGFSVKYRGSLFVAEGRSGRIQAVSLREEGSSYAVEKNENVVRPSPGEAKAIGSLSFGPGGSLYFIATGPGAVSTLFVLTLTGEKLPSSSYVPPEQALRGMRREMEKLSATPQPKWLDSVWINQAQKNCNHVALAVRRALEALPVDLWRKRALAEDDAAKALPALLALTRADRDSRGRSDIYESLIRQLPRCEDGPERIRALRILTSARERLGEPKADNAQALRLALRPWLSLDEPGVLLDTAAHLVALDDETVTPVCVPFLASGRLTRQEGLALVVSLAAAKGSLPQEQALPLLCYLDRPWQEADLPEMLVKESRELKLAPAAGANAAQYLHHLKLKVISRLPRDASGLADAAAGELAARLAQAAEASSLVARTGQMWNAGDCELLATPPAGYPASAERGRVIFHAARCSVCHDRAKPSAPPLEGLPARLGAAGAMEAILAPSRRLVPGHSFATLRLTDGTEVSGRILLDASDKVVLQPSLELPGTLTFAPDKVSARTASTRPGMPEGLLNGLSREKIADLMAYLGY